MLRPARLALVAAVLGLAVSGCGLDQLAQEGAERAVEEAVEQGASGDVDIDIDGEDGFRIEGEDGSFEVGATDLPDDFPSDLVPLVDGELIASARVTEGETTNWSANFQVPTEAGDAFAGALAALESAGYEAAQTTQSGTYNTALLEGNGLQVVLGALPDSSSGGSLVTYQVSTVSP
ncbi:hypothetical protein KUV85_13895 [Nocardioides panacisoli]|uniref:hypothetical protein n=1 Tax=Nocardioides panacisoli TaxID=627624 RepID=UPI001C62F2E2|nr:hypothetical protein [Nocardioides panacisoli]QYJ03412.1 hypothetical protein KUV85_13895 [Nocardioides panacisoli]